MSDFLIMFLCTLGAIVVLIAAIGIVRMPDFYLQLSVTIKAAVLGIGLLLAAAAIFFADVSITTKVLAITFFLVLTAPVAGHVIGRAAYLIGTKLWKKSVLDELKGKYDEHTNYLGSGEEDK
ncbi:monovalent cation/H(+) antiporter subunit G [Chitinophaga silvatica]|uniref:Monovalent cation/H(+) antiporter subunit G n=1 Tax=Chitinophaga silvatica TaxID=2282649 RepID=A0A3E1YAH6_9BACT|nr:monovalent cation/H(+) antiporter subunit G [Chitinophaga silvatica]RFS22719.1 monovalent cation/H(+) antiporter subunit G [Chitinophaga silvatica]